MGEHSYFGAGNGWNGFDEDSVMTTWIKDWPQYHLPLGEPIADADIQTSGASGETTTYHRSFGSGTTVFVNITVPPPSSFSPPPGSDESTSAARYDLPRIDVDLGSQITTTCIKWSDGTLSGNGCGEPRR